MEKLSKKEMSSLAKFEKAFNYAIKASCVPAMSKSELDELEIVYNKLGHKLESRRCGRCVLAMMRIIGEVYNENKNNTKERETKNGKTETKQKREHSGNTDNAGELGQREESSAKGLLGCEEENNPQ